MIRVYLNGLIRIITSLDGVAGCPLDWAEPDPEHNSVRPDTGQGQTGRLFGPEIE